MKESRLIIASLLVVALGAFGFVEWQSVRKLQDEIAQLQKEAAAQADASADAQAELEKLRKKVADDRQIIAQLDTPEKRAAASAEAAKALADSGAPEGADAGKEAGNTPDFGKMIKKMFTDPSMKKVMRGTQGVAVKMMYGSLGKELGLKAEASNQLMELLTDRQMARTTKGMKMSDGQIDEAQANAEAAADGEKSDQDLDAEIEAIIGKDGLTKLADYEKGMADRMQLTQYEQSFSSSGMALNEQQSKGLLGIMLDERTKQPPSPMDPGSKDVGASIKAMQSEDTMTKLMESQVDLNRRVLSRAGPILNPDQMVQFQQIQQQQLDMQKMQMDIARSMFKGK